MHVCVFDSSRVHISFYAYAHFKSLLIIFAELFRCFSHCFIACCWLLAPIWEKKECVSFFFEKPSSCAVRIFHSMLLCVRCAYFHTISLCITHSISATYNSKSPSSLSLFSLTLSLSLSLLFLIPSAIDMRFLSFFLIYRAWLTMCIGMFNAINYLHVFWLDMIFVSLTFLLLLLLTLFFCNLICILTRSTLNPHISASQANIRLPSYWLYSSPAFGISNILLLLRYREPQLQYLWTRYPTFLRYLLRISNLYAISLVTYIFNFGVLSLLSSPSSIGILETQNFPSSLRWNGWVVVFVLFF